jgi:hypothetical protein
VLSKHANNQVNSQANNEESAWQQPKIKAKKSRLSHVEQQQPGMSKC